MNQHNREYAIFNFLTGKMRTCCCVLRRFIVGLMRKITLPIYLRIKWLHLDERELGEVSDSENQSVNGVKSVSMTRIKIAMVLLLVSASCVFMLSHAWGLQKTTDEKPEIKKVEEKEPEPSPLLKEPKNADELYKAVLLMLDYGRLDLADKYFKQLNELEVKDVDLVALRKKFGTSSILRLINTPETSEEAKKFSKKLEDAAERQSRDPEVINALINELWQAPVKRNAAIIELRRLGKLALPQLLSVWQKETDPDHKTQLQSVIVLMGEHVSGQLIDGLSTQNQEMLVMLIDSLGRIRSKEAVPHILFYAVHSEVAKGTQTSAQQAIRRIYGQNEIQFSSSEAIKIYLQAADMHFSQKYIWRNLVDGKVETWKWNEENYLTATYLSHEESSLNAGTEYSRKALELDVSSTKAQTYYLSHLLLKDATEAGWGNDLPTGQGKAWDQLMSAGPERVADVLELSLEKHRTLVALPAIKAYIKLVSPEKFFYEFSPLQVALNYPDQRVQFITASTLLKSHPGKSFKGSSRLMEILRQNLTDNFDNNVIILDPNQERSHRMAQTMQNFSFQGITAVSGKEGFKICSASANISLVLIHCNIIDWELSQTLANFRTDPKTKYMPILIVAPEHLHPRYARHLENDSLAGIIPEPHDSLYFKSLIVPFLAKLPTPGLSPTERNANAKLALEITKTLAEQGNGIHNLNLLEGNLIRIASNARLSDDVIPVLGKIGTKASQEKLAYLTLTLALEMETRKRAAQALTENIKHFGNLLSKELVNELKQNWKSEDDQELRSLLSAFIGLMPQSDQQLGERLLQKNPTEKLTLK